MNIEVYYWLEAEYHNQKDCWALHRKNQNDNDEVVLSASYSDFEDGIENLDRSSAEYLDTVWRRIDQYIESELGFLPDYDVN